MSNNSINICRTCLNPSEQLSELFKQYEIDGESLKMCDIVEACTGLKIVIDDKNHLPKFICKVCVSKLCKSFIFRKQCLDADEILREQQDLQSLEDVSEVVVPEKEEFICKEEEREAEDCESWNDEEELEPEYLLEKEDDQSYQYILEETLSESGDIEMAYEVQDLELIQVLDTSKKQNRRGRKTKEISSSSQKCPNHLCAECGQSFKNLALLRSHYKLHNPETCFTCNICDKVFSYKSHLDIHKNIHSGEKKFVCSICGHEWPNKFDLNVHFRIHTNEKPFSCSDCDATFRTSSQFAEHKRRKHEAPAFKCEICEKSFKHRYVRDQHLLSHDPNNHFVCTFALCDKKYASKKNLRRHLRSHIDVFYPCSVCLKKFVKESDLIHHMKIHKKLDEDQEEATEINE